MLYLKFTKDDGWAMGSEIATRLVEAESSGVVLRFIDLSTSRAILDFAPSRQNQYGAIDHPLLSMTCDWPDNQIPSESFEKFWLKAQEGQK